MNASAQDYVAPPVSISKDKVKIDGKVFYSHIVLDKQTLYSISKAYNVSVEEMGLDPTRIDITDSFTG